MEPRHSLLKRQLKRQFGAPSRIPKEWEGFIAVVDEAYQEFDMDRAMLERCLDLSSQELVQANSEMRAVFQAIPDLLFRLDAEGRILDYKASGTTELLIAPEELRGKRIQDVPFKDVGERFNRALKQIREQKSITSIEYSLAVRGKEYFYEARLVPLLENQVVVIVRNMTEHKRAQAEREALIAELEAKNAELERFSFTVSHDLKSPLITILGFCDFIQQDARRGNIEQLTQDTERITRAAEKMAELLNDLLELSRIGRVKNPPQDVAFNELAREAVSLVDGLLRARGVAVAIAPDLPHIHGDRARLLQVLQNLLENAAKYMGIQQQPYIEIGARGTGAETIVYVRDNGIGIEPRYHERIFGLFEKLDPKSQGTGIGLATVKRIVELHGGRIWVESDGMGNGSTFCLALPWDRD